jgi:hypothetical protein
MAALMLRLYMLIPDKFFARKGGWVKLRAVKKGTWKQRDTGNGPWV